MATEREVCKFVDLVMVFGEDFDLTLPWARDVLDQPHPGAAAKIEELIRRGTRALEGSPWCPPR